MRKTISLGIVSLLILMVFSAVPMNVGAYTVHAKIFIDGDSQFTAANGVTGGSGSAGDPYIIENWEIDVDYGPCIRVENTDAYFIVRNCYLSNPGTGFSGSGVHLQNVRNGTVRGNIISGHWWGVYLRKSEYNLVTENTVRSCTYTGIFVYEHSNHTLVTKNICYDNKDFNIQIAYYSCHNRIEENDLSNSNYGVYINHGDYNVIHKNVIHDHPLFAVYSQSANENVISHNSIYDNTEGVTITRGCLNNTIHHNIIKNFESNGIFVSAFLSFHEAPTYIHNNTIINLTLTCYESGGIQLFGNGLDDCIVEYNTIIDCDRGIFVVFGAHDNIIRCNTISNSSEAGILCDDRGSANNLFYHNNFLNNAQHVIGSRSADIWDNGYPTGGNYWDTYPGVDNYNGPLQNIPGPDGIGDTPYSLNGTGVDRYPLMEAWGELPEPDEAIDDLIEDIEDMDLAKGTENSLISKLENAKAAYLRGSENAAMNLLNALINQAEALRGNKLTDEKADHIISAAQKIIDLIASG